MTFTLKLLFLLTMKVLGLLLLSTLAASFKVPQFQPYSEVLDDSSFFEQFSSKKALNNWVPTRNENYNGKWAFEESNILNGVKDDKGLVLKTQAAKHAISYKFDNFFQNENSSLVFQYELKFQKSVECSGGYVKLLDGPFKQTEFSNETPYSIMFGPDKCGASNRVHFIINLKNPKDGKIYEFSLKKPPMARVVQTTSLYSLIINPDNSFEIRINGEIVRYGNLLSPEDFDMNLPTQITDVADTKPEDWVDDEYIDDPEDIKPENWEDEPEYIPDFDAEMPNDWEENEPAQIPDPDDLKPEDWDDEEDGEFIPKMIDNPKCTNIGCGKWIRPEIKNPNFKGVWKPRKIKNPNYKGKWEPRMIPNPNYFEIQDPYKFENISGLGFELWTMESDILLDNIYFGHSVEEIENIGNKTFIPKLKNEHYLIISNEISDRSKADQPDEDVNEYYEYIMTILDKFLDDLKFYVFDVINVPATLYERPGEALYFSSVIVVVLSIVISFWTLVINFIARCLDYCFDYDNSNYTELKADEIIESITEKTGASSTKKNQTKAKKR